MEKKFKRRLNVSGTFLTAVGHLTENISGFNALNSTSLFYNYKGTYRIILFAMVDAEYCFRYIDVGCDGRSNDSTIFNNSTLKIALDRNILNWPIGRLCVADDAFGLTSYMLKPY